MTKPSSAVLVCASLPASALLSVPASSAVDRRAVEENGVSGGEWLPAAILPACGTNASADWGAQSARAVTREAKHVAVGRFIVIWGVSNNELIRVELFAWKLGRII